MAAPFLTSYYVGIGTAISAQGVPTELSGGSYARQACGFTGTAISGLTQSFSAWVVATAPTPAVPSFYGLLYDASGVGANLIGYWNWNPTAGGVYTGSLTAFPATVVNITFNQYISIALNMALTGGQGTTGALVDLGSQLGTVNGNPFLAGCRLSIGAGGSLVPHIGGGQWIGSADVQNTLYASTYGSGNIATGLASNSSTTLVGGTVMSAFINVVSTSGGATYSCTLPSVTSNPGAPGTWLTVINTSGTSLVLFPDLAANQINAITAGSGTTLTTHTALTCYRVSATNWITVPYAAS